MKKKEEFIKKRGKNPIQRNSFNDFNISITATFHFTSDGIGSDVSHQGLDNETMGFGRFASLTRGAYVENNDTIVFPLSTLKRNKWIPDVYPMSRLNFSSDDVYEENFEIFGDEEVINELGFQKFKSFVYLNNKVVRKRYVEEGKSDIFKFVFDKRDGGKTYVKVRFNTI